MQHKINGRLTIRPRNGASFTARDRTEETRILRKDIWPAVTKLIASEWPGCTVAFTADNISDLCDACGEHRDELTAEDAAELGSVAGEPSCCEAARGAFHAARESAGAGAGS